MRTAVLASLLLAGAIFFPPNATLAQSGWIIEPIPGADAGSNHAIALDETYLPHVVYSTYGSQVGPSILKYTVRRNGSWTIAEEIDEAGARIADNKCSIAIDRFGQPHVGYTYEATNFSEHGEIRYATLAASSWLKQSVRIEFSGGYVTLRLDSNDSPRMTYSGRGLGAPLSGVAYYAYPDGSGNWVSLDNDGRAISFALDSQDQPHIALIGYGPELYGDLLYAIRDVTGFDTVAVAGMSQFSPPSIQLDGYGNPHIIFMRRNTGTNSGPLMYATKVAGAWMTEVIDSSAYFDYYPLALDGCGNPHVAYRSAWYDSVRYARNTEAGWVVETVDDDAGTAVGVSIAVSDAGVPHILYTDGTTNTLNYATKLAPATPSSLMATLLCPPAAFLSWQHNSSDETVFEIQMKANGLGDWIDVAMAPANATEWTSGPLDNGVTYSFRLRSCNSTLCSTWLGPDTLVVQDPQERTITGSVRGVVVEKPYEMTPTDRGLVGTQITLYGNGSPSDSVLTTGPDGTFELTDAILCDAQLESSLNNPTLKVYSLAAPLPSGCNSPCLFQPIPAGGILQFIWSAQDVVNAVYLVEKYEREYWEATLNVTPVIPYILEVESTSRAVQRGAGAVTAVDPKTRLPMTACAPGRPQYRDAMYHEFVHRMVIEKVGEHLSRGYDVYHEARGMDEGLADYFTVAYTDDMNFGFGIPGLPPRQIAQNEPYVYTVCSGKYDADAYYGARVFGGALWDTRVALTGLGADGPSIDRWIFDALEDLRGLNPYDRTFLLFRHILLNRPPFNSGLFASAIRKAFGRHNITENPLAICPERPIIENATRTVDASGQHIQVVWSSVQGAALYRLYMRPLGSETGLGLGLVVGDSLTVPHYTYTDTDTSLTLAFVVTAIDSAGNEGAASGEIPAVTGVAETRSSLSMQLSVFPNPSKGILWCSWLSPVNQRIEVRIYDIAGRLVRMLWGGETQAQSERKVAWHGEDTEGHQVGTGVYFVTVDGRAARIVQRAVFVP
jgi:hypothetical protein